MREGIDPWWGFWSYAHFDNERDRETLVRLCQRLIGEVRAHSGRNFDIFIDQIGLHIGQQWEDEVEAALERADVLIPIVTPSYFASERCRQEYNFFKARELDFGRNDLIAPIYYISCPEFESKTDEGLSSWAVDLRSRQYGKFCFLRTGSRNSVQAARRVEEFAKGLLHSLNESRSSPIIAANEPVPPPPSTPVDEPLQIASATIDSFSQLPQTQRNLIAFLYTLHKDYIGVDDLYSTFGKKFGQTAVGSSTELHYRLQVLQFQGLISLSAVGHRTTVVKTIAEVGRLLFERKLIST